MATLVSTYRVGSLLEDATIVRTAPVSVDFIHGKELHYHPECKNHAYEVELLILREKKILIDDPHGPIK